MTKFDQGPHAYATPLGFAATLPFEGYLMLAAADARSVYEPFDQAMKAAGAAEANYPPGSDAELASQLWSAVLLAERALASNDPASAAKRATAVALLWAELRQRRDSGSNAQDPKPAALTSIAKATLIFVSFVKAQPAPVSKAKSLAYLQAQGCEGLSTNAFTNQIWASNAPDSWKAAGRKGNRQGA